MIDRIAEFGSAEALIEAVKQSAAQGFEVRDALTPYPVEELNDLVPHRKPHLRVPMALAGFGMALLAFALETWTAVYAYAFDSGGRPPFSWPIFMLVPFEVGILAGGAAGFIALLIHCGLPRLHHPIFAVEGIERATDDHFFLVLAEPAHERAHDLDQILIRSGALSLRAVEP